MSSEQITQILDEVCRKYGIRRNVLDGRSRDAWLVKARIEAVSRLRDEMKLSFPHIAAILNYCDHTTPQYHYRNWKKRNELKAVSSG